MPDASPEETDDNGESRPAAGAAVQEAHLSVDDLVCSEDLESIDTKDDPSVTLPDKTSSLSSIVANANASAMASAKPPSAAAASMRKTGASGKNTTRKRQAKQFYGDNDSPEKKHRKVPSKDRAKAKSTMKKRVGQPPTSRRPTKTRRMFVDEPVTRERKGLKAPPHSATAEWNARLQAGFQGSQGGKPTLKVSALEILQQAQERLTLPPTTFPPRDSPLNSVFQQGYSRVDDSSSPTERDVYAALEKCYIFILSQDVHDEVAIRQKYQSLSKSEQMEAMRHLQGESARLRAREKSLFPFIQKHSRSK
jgi:hypothetical protein